MLRQDYTPGEGVGLCRLCSTLILAYYSFLLIIKVRGGRGKESLYIGCIYMPTTTASVSTMDACYENLKEDVLIFKGKGKVMLLGDFNARVGTASEIDEVIGMFGED